MAAPENMTTKDISGRYYLNKTLSDSIDPILVLQGVSWATRTVLAYATVTLDVSHYTDDKQIEHIDIDQTITGGIKGTSENRTMDWVERTHEDHIFGAVLAKSRRVKLDEITDPFLKNDWIESVAEHGFVHSYVVSDKSKNKYDWTAEQIWGFEKFDGEKRYTRHLKLVANGGKDVIEAKLIYDYAGPNPNKP
ncbi:hypothetical protein SISSUDRAFT_1041657 [Sistotremastrum suecicum HHB10207 ss-3]|uniref:Uncharacterized protein n=1 Tax=Sistotremastrum suecicum HHB10207 ss-3 TaxID=1314776 RepID=A0A166H5B6_9AGAM|nr:hypothetical protein SISSUDRAFT_1041657 [Sistotremastrum suecicum HHB10207 ss-3]